jgi:hypothetical protein
MGILLLPARKDQAEHCLKDAPLIMSGVKSFSIIKVYHYCEVVKGPGQNTRHMGREIAEK